MTPSPPQTNERPLRLTVGTILGQVEYTFEQAERVEAMDIRRAMLTDREVLLDVWLRRPRPHLLTRPIWRS